MARREYIIAMEVEMRVRSLPCMKKIEVTFTARFLLHVSFKLRSLIHMTGRVRAQINRHDVLIWREDVMGAPLVAVVMTAR